MTVSGDLGQVTSPNDSPTYPDSALLDPSLWAERVAAADAEALVLAEVLERVRGGESRRAALAALVPDRPHRTMLTRLRRFEDGGRNALVDRRAPKARPTKVTPEVKAAIRALAHTRPELCAEALAEELDGALGVRLGSTTMRVTLASLGLARDRGRPRGSKNAVEQPVVTALPLAGAELLKATEEELGAVRALTKAMGKYLESLPAPTGEVLDDRDNRDERGRFLPSYNEAKSRTETDLGGRFDSVERRRGEKDLREMRVANSSFSARYRKDFALTLLPIVLEGPRWSGLTHWRGAQLESLVGHAYMPATLDKHARELKLSGASEACREATAAFWMKREGLSDGGGLVVYIDAATKPVWTRNYTRCTKVSSNGRVMPGMSTVWLNSGSGTPLVYRTFSGTTSVPREVPAFLRQVEAAAGEGTTERLVVLDRESHAVWLFKELIASDWQFVVPLRSSVTGPKAPFEQLAPWQPYGTAGDETREGWLWLNDSRKGEGRIRIRVVARRRHRTGKVAWYATNTDIAKLDATAVIDHYFARWPLQEHVFRDGNGRVGLDIHHGYGKKRVTHIAVVSRLAKLDRLLTNCREELARTESLKDSLAEEKADWATAEQDLREMLAVLMDDLEHRIAASDTSGSNFAEQYADSRRYMRWLDEARAEITRIQRALDKTVEQISALTNRQVKLGAEHAKRAGKTTIFTVDTELDEIMTGYKLTFMNLAFHLMREHMAEPMELDTLIRSVLTLPGERALTKSTETIRIYRQPRDPRAMASVERAIGSLNKLGLTRGPEGKVRALRFELVDPPDPSGSA